MKFLGDESVDDPIIHQLRSANYDVQYIKEISPGVDDDEVLKLAFESERILITMDKDFGELVYRKGSSHAGVVLIRLDAHTPDERASLLLKVFTRHDEELMNAFTVIQAHFTRIRPM